MVSEKTQRKLFNWFGFGLGRYKTNKEEVEKEQERGKRIGKIQIKLTEETEPNKFSNQSKLKFGLLYHRKSN